MQTTHTQTEFNSFFLGMYNIMDSWAHGVFGMKKFHKTYKETDRGRRWREGGERTIEMWEKIPEDIKEVGAVVGHGHPYRTVFQLKIG